MFPKNKIINNDSSNQLSAGKSRKARIITASAFFFALCAFGAVAVVPRAPDASNLPVKFITQELALPTLAEQISAISQNRQPFVHEEKIRAGDTLATLLSRLGVNDDAATAFIKNDKTAHAVLQLKAGKQVQAQTTEDGALQWLRAPLSTSKDNVFKNLVITRDGEKFSAAEVTPPLEKRVEMLSGVIKSSLFATMDAAQVADSDALVAQIVDMFSTNIDFASDLRRGDRFDVVYETFWQNGQFIRSGRILAGEFINAGTKYQSVWFDDPNSKEGGSYFGLDGKSLKKAFLKSPLEFSRISSGFSMRLHPISGQWKQHKGIDFAAATGTAIRASGDGTIDFIGKRGGYGNMVVIKHWAHYSTAYGHMSRFNSNLRQGSKVHQGEVIGYVGTTGWSTGPHLHYEFRVNNEPRDPMSVNIQNAQTLTGPELARFSYIADDMGHRFALLNPESKDIKLASR